MIEVNRAKRSPSNIRKSRKIMVAGGEYAGQAWNSLVMHVMQWLIARKSAWNDIEAM